MGNGNIAVRQWLRDKERFADLFNGVVFGGAQVVLPEELEESDSESSVIVADKLAKEKGVQRHRDIVMRWKRGTSLAVLACENQQKVHYAMPVRAMMYDSLAYHEQIRQLWKEKTGEEKKGLSGEEYLSHFGKEDRLFPVLTLVLYYGTGEWDASQDLHEMFQIAEDEKEKRALEKYIPNYRINLIDMEREEHTERFKTDLQVIWGMVKYRSQKEKLLDYVQKHEEYFGSVDKETFRAVREFLHSEKLLKEVAPGKEEKEETVDMCKALEELYADGERNGEAKGENIFAALTEKLIKASRMDDLLRATSDIEFRGKLYREYKIKG